MAHRSPRTSRVAVAAATVIGLATLTVAAPALGQVDPGASSSTTAVDATATTVGADASTTAVDPAAETTEVPADADTTVPVPVPVDTPFPAPLVAPVPPVAGDPDTDITDLYVTDGAEPDQPDVVVQFRQPFTFALTQYQLGVVIGDPSGTRLRTWLISNGPDALPYGRVERFEAGTWSDVGATPVRFENGLMVITVPIAEAPTGGAVWVEINENGDEAPSYTTPFFSRDALFGTADAGTIPSAIFGRVYGTDGLSTEVVPELPTGGVLVSIEDRIAVSYTDPPPAEVIGVPVSESIDVIRIAPDFDEGAVITHFVRLNRTTGEVGLYDGFSPVPIDRTGDRSWLVAAPGAGEAGSLVLDRPAVLAALGVTDDATRVGLGVSREIALEDGRVITAEGVLGTDAWLDLAPASALPEVTTTVATGDEASGAAVDESNLPLLIAAAVGLVVLLVLVVLWRRASARRSAGAAAAAADAPPPKVDRMPWGSTDGDLIITTTHEFDALIPADATPMPGPSPVAPTAVPSGPAGNGVRIIGSPVGSGAADAGPAPEPAPATDPASGPTPAEPVRDDIPEMPVAVSPLAPPAAAAAAATSPAAPEPAGTADPASGPLDAEPVWAEPAAPAVVAPAVAGAPEVAAPAMGTDPVDPVGPPAPPAAVEAPATAAPTPPSPASAPAAMAVASAAAGPEIVLDDGDGDTIADGGGGEDEDEDGDGAPAPLEPGRVDPMAALSALDDDMAELRRRVASLGER